MVSPLDFLKPGTQYASEGTALERMNTCRGCDRLLPMKICRECGCFMPAKVTLADAACPINKW